jgi:hypothetical protein
VSAYGDFGPGNEDSLEYADVLKNWDDEDVAAYRDVVEGKEDVDLLGGYIFVELDAATSEALVARARERGVDPGRLASDLLRDAMSESE